MLKNIANFFKKSTQITLSRTSASVVITSIVLLIDNSKFFLNKLYDVFLKDFSYFALFSFCFEFALHYFLIFLFFFIITFNKKLFNICAIIIFILTSISAYIYNSFGILIDQTIIANALDNLSDADKIIDYIKVVIYTFVFVVLPTYLIFKIKIQPIKNPKKYYYLTGIFLFFVLVLASFQHDKRKGVMVAYAPISFIDSIRIYYQELHATSNYKNNLVKISTIINDAKFDKNKMPNLKVVLIIGESARSMNFSINGYERETTPNLKKIKNLISFKNVTPCANLTSYSVSCMLSGKTEKEFFAKQNENESIIKLFENLSFKTYWFSTQKAVGDNNSLLFLGTQAQKYIFKNTITKNIGGKHVYDEYLLDYLSKETDSKKDKFIVLHTEGSHFLFDERYPENFKIFKPTCAYKSPEKCDRQSIINSYDNSVLYTDYFISKVIDELKDKNAILFYISDHGQFLGEEGIYYHGNFGSHKNVVHKVPMFLWMSDSILKNPYYKNKFSKAASKRNQTLSHDNLFDSLLDCSGIDSTYFDRNLSICR